jgi:hypothetical protein
MEVVCLLQLFVNTQSGRGFAAAIEGGLGDLPQRIPQ